jgi:hypothetical protein
MNLLLLGVFFFFGLHTALWLARSLTVGKRGKDNGVSGEQ